MNPQLTNLFCQHVAATFDKQMQLADLIGERSWRFDKDSGLLSFGDDLQWHTQILGSEAEDSQTWLWAWANKASQIPPNLTQAADAMQKFGTEHRIQSLTDPQVPLEQADSHSLSTITAGVLNAHAYFRGPYTGGAIFLLITDPTFPRASDNPLLRIISKFPQAISAYAIANHREAFIAYLSYYGLPSRVEDSRIVVEQDGKVLLTATFDTLNRLVTLNGTISPSSPIQQKKPWWKLW